MKNAAVSLRERKYAKTKIMITQEFIRELNTKRFEDVSITDICRHVEVSEGTFYNYFPHKLDVLMYYLAIDGIRWQWEVDKRSRGKGTYDALRTFYAVIAARFNKPHFIYELVGALVGEQYRDVYIEISDLEKRLAFPKCGGIEKYAYCAPEGFFRKKVGEAQKNGDLPPKHRVGEVVSMLHSILCGTALAVPENQFATLTTLMQKQFTLLWKGLGGK